MVSALSKHGIRFEQAMRMFADPFALANQDRIKVWEYRWQTTSKVERMLVLRVAHSMAEDSVR